MNSKTTAIVLAALVAGVGLGAAGTWYMRTPQASAPAPVAAAPAPAVPAVSAVAVAQPADSLPPLAPGRVFADMFGVQTDQKSAAIGPGELATVWHQQVFNYGQDKVQVVFTASQELDPSTKKPLEGHAQAPAISAAVYRLKNGQWESMGANKHFARAGAWGEVQPLKAPATLLTMPSGIVAFLIDTVGTGQGYMTTGQQVWSFSNWEWHDLGFVETGLDNEGAVGDGPEHFSYTGTISIAPGPGKDSIYPDLLVTRKGTTRDDSGKVVTVADTRFGFNGKEYEEIRPKK